MTREQLLALLREAYGYMDHPRSCHSWRGEFANCNCGMRSLKLRIQDALATERTETNDGDDDGN